MVGLSYSQLPVVASPKYSSTPNLLARQYKKPVIGDIKLPIEDPGCYFHDSRDSTRTVFYESSTNTMPIINIDGQNTRLKGIKMTENRNKSKWIYRSGKMTVVMNLVKFKEEEGVGFYNVFMTVNRGLSKSVAKLVGTYGC